jgi:hypothetical protein
LTTAFTLTNVSGVEINGFVVENYTNFGIQTAFGGGNHRIVQNKIKNISVGTGIIFRNPGNLAWRNEIERNGGGLDLENFNNWAVGNSVHNNANGGVFTGGGNHAIIDNKIIENGFAGIDNDGDNTLIVGNEIIENAIGIDSDGSNAVILENNIIDNVAPGVAIGEFSTTTQNVFVGHNVIKDNENSGILIRGQFNNVENNEIKHNENNGIELTNTSTKNFILRNEVKDNKPHNIQDNGTDNEKVKNEMN